MRVCSVFPGKSHHTDEAGTAEFKAMPAGTWGKLALLQVEMLFVTEVAHRCQKLNETRLWKTVWVVG